MQNFLVSFRHFMPLLSVVYSKRNNLTINTTFPIFIKKYKIPFNWIRQKKKLEKISEDIYSTPWKFPEETVRG